MRITEYNSWFALSNYTIKADAQDLELRLWQVFPERCLTFWPYLLKDASGFKEYLERDMPVEIDTRMTRLGRFTTSIQWLKAWIKVEWRGKIWCISRDGRMWLYEHGRTNDNEAGNVIWKVTEQEELQAPMTGVFRSPLSTEVIASFLDEFKSFKWFDAANEIIWERRAGMDLFTLRLTHGTQRFELYLQRDKYRGQDIGIILDELFNRLINEGGNHVIDATYDGKILLRNL